MRQSPLLVRVPKGTRARRQCCLRGATHGPHPALQAHLHIIQRRLSLTVTCLSFITLHRSPYRRYQSASPSFGTYSNVSIPRRSRSCEQPFVASPTSSTCVDLVRSTFLGSEYGLLRSESPKPHARSDANNGPDGISNGHDATVPSADDADATADDDERANGIHARHGNAELGLQLSAADPGL